VLYTLGIFKPRSSLIGQGKVEIILGSRPLLLMLYLASNLLSWPKVVCTYGKIATKFGFVSVWEVVLTGLIAC
jgi:hypothetical protein